MNAREAMEAEYALVGSALVNAAEVVNMADLRGIGPDSFVDPKCRVIWRAIKLDVAQYGTSDAAMVGSRLAGSADLNNVGGVSGINSMLDSTPTAAHAPHYMDILSNNSLIGAVAELAARTQFDARTADDGQKLLADSVRRLSNLAIGGARNDGNGVVVDRILLEWRTAAESSRHTGLAIPLAGVNQLLGGLDAGTTILAGRPSAGKTTLEDMICCCLARDGVPVGRITLDSTRDELLKRAISRESGVPLPVLKFGRAGRGQYERAAEAAETIKRWPIHLEDKLRDLGAITAQIRAWHTRYGIRLATLDYIQLVRTGESDPNRRISDVSGVLKLLALELGIPMLILSQLSRAIEKEGRSPRLSDLRDSGSLEQDAHKVAFLYRDQAWIDEREEMHPGSTRRERRAILEVLKNKDGETGKIALMHHADVFEFTEEAQSEGGSI